MAVRRLLLPLTTLLFTLPALARPAGLAPRYAEVVQRVGNLTHDGEAQALASRHGLQILNVLWEDTGRWQGSSVGPNISDVTIEVRGEDAPPTLMPVIRFPNFTDKTGDVPLDRIILPVGNQKEGGKLSTVSLKEFLANPARYLSDPEDGKIKGGSLLAKRDSHALVSAQAVFLPVPTGAQATFHPVIFNYQSTAKNPAVLTLLVTRQGTSMTVIDNARDTVSGGASWGQRLFFNSGGQRAPLTAERRSDVEANGVTANGEAASTLNEDANLLMLIQVPLKYREPPRRKLGLFGMSAAAPAAGGAAMETQAMPTDLDDTEEAVLGHGALEGPYTELDGLTVERDERFPVRVTVQFYQATSTGKVAAPTMERLAAQIARVYEDADHVGSLVVPRPEDLERPTNWDGVSPAPKDVSWWHFPGLRERFERFGWLGREGAKP